MSISVPKLHHIFIALALMALMGQSVSATVLPCGMNNSGMDMMSDSHMDTMGPSDCCEGDGDCSMSGCIVTPSATASQPSANLQFAARTFDLYALSPANPHSASLFRPPISR